MTTVTQREIDKIDITAGAEISCFDDGYPDDGSILKLTIKTMDGKEYEAYDCTIKMINGHVMAIGNITYYEEVKP